MGIKTRIKNDNIREKMTGFNSREMDRQYETVTQSYMNKIENDFIFRLALISL